MSTFVFAAQPAMGHVNPMLTIARQMRSEGHTIVFFTCPAPEHIKHLIALHGFHFISARPPLRTLGFLLLPFTSGYLETFMAITLFTSGLLYYARAVRHVLDEYQPDAVVSDFAFSGACLASESKNIPYVVIHHAGLSFPGPGIPPFGSGLPIGAAWGWKGGVRRVFSNFLGSHVRKTMARARRRLGLSSPEEGSPTPLFSPWLTLVLTAEAAEAPRFPLPRTTFFIGPCLAGRESAQESEFPFDQLSPHQPKVYVSLGTVFNRRPTVFGKILGAFDDGRYQVIVSAGGALARLRARRWPSHVLLFERVPQLEVLARVDVVVSHGGNNTVNETLAAGKPLLVIPVGGEQGDNASRVVHLGVGLRADLRRATSHEIGVKVTRLLEDPAFRQRAQEIREALAQTQGAVTAARFIDHVAKSKQPMQRPHGYPLTVTRETAPPWEWRSECG